MWAVQSHFAQWRVFMQVRFDLLAGAVRYPVDLDVIYCHIGGRRDALGVLRERLRAMSLGLVYTEVVGKPMTMDTESPANEATTRQTRGTSRNGMSWILGALLGVVLTVVLLGALVWSSTGLGLLHLMSMLRGGRAQINVDQPTVVRQIQQLQRLETVSYTMDKIISGEHSSEYLPKFLVGDRLLLVVHGEVIGGINLGALQAGDVVVQGQKVSIHLPTAELFSTRIDNAKTKVYSRDTGLFSSADPNLESEVREEAERQLQQAALQDGILKTAGDNARSTITGMLQGFGFHEVEIH